MARYIISYDLIDKDEDDYEDLYEALKQIGAKKIQKSVWGVPSKFLKSWKVIFLETIGFLLEK